VIDALKHLPGRHDQQRHAPKTSAGVQAIISTVRRELDDWALTSEREQLLDDFENEFPQALAAGGISADDVQELYVFGSYISNKPVPGDLDLVALVPPGTKFTGMPPGRIFETDVWPQHRHKAPIAFVKDRQFLNSLLDTFAEDMPDGYVRPYRIYP
jgi:hypothetical protein